MPDPTCHYCEQPAEAQCPTCGRLYCADHGDDVCVRCLSPQATVPSAAVYRGSILTLVVATALAGYLLISPPSDDSNGSQARTSTQSPTAEPTQQAQPTATPGAGGGTPEATTTTGATPEPTDGAGGERTHTVVDGDTLSGIADQYGVSVEQIQAANPGVTLDPLGLGTVLVIPEGE